MNHILLAPPPAELLATRTAQAAAAQAGRACADARAGTVWPVRRADGAGPDAEQN